MKASVRIKNVKYPIILTGLVVEFVDTVVVHIQRICNIRSHLGPLDRTDLGGCNFHYTVVCNMLRNRK